MLRRRWILLLLVTVLVGGTLGASLAYGFYRRSRFYAGAVAAALTEFFNLPTDVGGSVPLTLRGDRFFDVVVWLPGRRGVIFAGRQADWRPSEEPEDGGHRLCLDGGQFVIDSTLWEQDDYRRVLESGLGHNFAELNLEKIDIRHLDFSWCHGDFGLQTRRASGAIFFDASGEGRAVLSSRWLGDYEAEEPINITARFHPRGALTIEQVVLEVPQIPLPALGLEQVLRSPVTSGDFSGEVRYSESGGAQRVAISGDLQDVRLEEVTGYLRRGPIGGRIRMHVDSGVIVDRRLTELAFRGRIDELDVSSITNQFGLPDVGGRARIVIHEGEIRDNDIQWLGLNGRVEGISLEALAPLLGRGVITGSLKADIRSLVVRQGRIESAEVLVKADLPEGQTGLISRELVQDIVARLTGLNLPDFLPEQLEYTKLGARLIIEGDSLRVLGAHGARNTTILTVKAFGREIGVLFQPSRDFDIGPLIDGLRRRAEETRIEDLQRWWDAYRGPALPPPP
jgi:hypothetical protein